MPECPEVLEYFNFITPFFTDKILYDLDILSGKYLKKPINNFNMFREKLPSKIKKILIKGKTIFICLENEYSLVITHGMTGYWSMDKEKHGRLCFNLGDEEIFYVDSRNFGTITICLNEQEFNYNENKLGPYVLEDNITFDKFYSRLNKKHKSKIAVALLDQNLISGIGNYLRCDILWYAQLDGEKRIGELTYDEKTRLYEATINICRYYANLSYKLEFTPEDFNRNFFIYMEKRDIYNNPIETKKINGRTFHFVNTQRSV